VSAGRMVPTRNKNEENALGVGEPSAVKAAAPSQPSDKAGRPRAETPPSRRARKEQPVHLPEPDAGAAPPAGAGGKRTAAKPKMGAASNGVRAAGGVGARRRRRRPVRRRAQNSRKTAVGRPSIRAREPRRAANGGLAAIHAELRDVRALLQRLSPMPAGTAASDTDAALEASVDSLRRLLSELIEQRTESVVRALVDIRREALALSPSAGGRLVDRLDHVLDTLGAVRFSAEPMDVLDPLIHVVLDERQVDGVPEGVILETLRPGYRTGRGLVVCKAAVAVNRKS
jgi:molecular chaperone GrpE (heat shock protein)